MYKHGLIMLAAKNPIKGDSLITFHEPTHKYSVKGKVVPISVTALGARAVPEEHRFDGRAIIKKNLSNWRSNASNKHHELVHGFNDRDAIDNVFKSWGKNRDAGTDMHKAFEQFLNDEVVEKEDEFGIEMSQLRVAMGTLRNLKPVRTELSIFANGENGDAAIAGQIDLLMKDEDGDLHILDYKRTSTDLAPGAFSYGKSFLDGLPLNDHHKYSLQLALYAAIFEIQTGTPIVSTVLLQVHPDLDSAQVVSTTDMRRHALELLRSVGVVVHLSE